VEKITLGPARRILLNPVGRECTAYHESGHALLGLLVPGSAPMHRVAIVPRGMARSGHLSAPHGDDRTSYAEDYLRAPTRAVSCSQRGRGVAWIPDPPLSRLAHALVTP
jgi:cell division protease FtsH